MQKSLINTGFINDIDTMMYPITRRIIQKYDFKLSYKQIEKVVKFIKNDFCKFISKLNKNLKQMHEEYGHRYDVKGELSTLYCEQFEYSE